MRYGPAGFAPAAAPAGCVEVVARGYVRVLHAVMIAAKQKTKNNKRDRGVLSCLVVSLSLLLAGHGELQADELEALRLEALDDLTNESAVHTLRQKQQHTERDRTSRPEGGTGTTAASLFPGLFVRTIGLDGDEAALGLGAEHTCLGSLRLQHAQHKQSRAAHAGTEGREQGAQWWTQPQ